MMRILFLFIAGLFLNLPAYASDGDADGETSQPAYTSQQEAIEALKALVGDQEISLALEPDLMIHGSQPVVITRGVWTDEQVARYQRAFGETPLVLPLTRVQPEDESKRNREDSLEMYFLSIRRPVLDAQDGRLRDQLRLLIEDDFQAALAEKRFEKLPPALVETWRVRLGVQAPRFEGGYR